MTFFSGLKSSQAESYACGNIMGLDPCFFSASNVNVRLQHFSRSGSSLHRSLVLKHLGLNVPYTWLPERDQESLAKVGFPMSAKASGNLWNLSWVDSFPQMKSSNITWMPLQGLGRWQHTAEPIAMETCKTFYLETAQERQGMPQESL